MTLLLLITLIDGSTLNIDVDPRDTMSFFTDYGTIKVPLAKVRACEIGPHADNPDIIREMIKALGASDHKVRDHANKWLHQWRRQSYSQLVANKDHDDAEIKNRVQHILEAGPKYRLFDTITLVDGTMNGNVQEKYIKGHSKPLGDMKIAVSEIVNIQVRFQQRTVTVPAGGSPIELGSVSGEIRIKARGVVDLYPTSPGQYTSNPDGIPPMAGGYNAGALLGRIDGRVFLIGSDFSAANVRGRLELFINRAPDVWIPFVQPTGSYEVEIE